MPEASFWSKGPCDCEKYPPVPVPDLISRPIQKWREIANECGKIYNVNPVIFLAISTIESRGNYQAEHGNKYGIVQMDMPHVRGYNCLNGTKYLVNDLQGNGYYCKNEYQAVTLSFSILGQFLSTFLKIEKDLGLATTCWNDNVGRKDPVFPYGKEKCGLWFSSTSVSCYGRAIEKLVYRHSHWGRNSSSNRPIYEFSTPLKEISVEGTIPQIKLCLGPKYKRTRDNIK
jgi:hypothetical protein